MTPAEIKADYRATLAAVGEVITIRRYTGAGPTRPRFDAEVRARVAAYEPHELVGNIVEGERKAIILAEDLIAAQIALPLVVGDNLKAVVRGKEVAVKAVDDNTRRVAGELVAIELRIGA